MVRPLFQRIRPNGQFVADNLVFSGVRGAIREIVVVPVAVGARYYDQHLDGRDEYVLETCAKLTPDYLDFCSGEPNPEVIKMVAECLYMESMWGDYHMIDFLRARILVFGEDRGFGIVEQYSLAEQLN